MFLFPFLCSIAGDKGKRIHYERENSLEVGPFARFCLPRSANVQYLPFPLGDAKQLSNFAGKIEIDFHVRN